MAQDSNNAWPINSGRCCDGCNTIVDTHRLRNVARGLGAYADPQWYQDIVASVTEFWQEHKTIETAKLDAEHNPPLKGLELTDYFGVSRDPGLEAW